MTLSKTVLWIDDDIKRMAPSLIEALEWQDLYVARAHSVEDALKMFAEMKDRLDLIIMDILMPPGSLSRSETDRGRRTGLVLLRKFSEISGSVPPVIVLTVVRDKHVKKRALEMGVAYYLTKPCRPSKLRSVAQKFLCK